MLPDLLSLSSHDWLGKVTVVVAAATSSHAGRRKLSKDSASPCVFSPLHCVQARYDAGDLKPLQPRQRNTTQHAQLLLRIRAAFKDNLQYCYNKWLAHKNRVDAAGANEVALDRLMLVRR